MRYRIRHQTRYCYEQPVQQCHNVAFLLPRTTPNQHVNNVEVRITPSPLHQSEHIDYFGNRFLHFTIEQPHQQLDVDIVSDVTVQNCSTNTPVNIDISCADVRDLLTNHSEWATLQAREFMLESPHIPLLSDLAEYARESFVDARPFWSSVLELTQRIHQDFVYDPQFTHITTPIVDVVKYRRGVCQDFAQVAIGCLRSLGYAARYVSGYIETIPPDGETKLMGADASHAWFSVYLPNDGWYDFDPTNNMLTKAQHITTAWGRDYSDVTPLKGILLGGGNNPLLTVSVDVYALSINGLV
jgi:transglutaminase-like putative cysteine protease